jgi:hypothetical protein
MLMLLATMVLLFFRRIYLDAETKQPIKFTLPILGEISTQAPVLVLVIIGMFMVVYPLSKMSADVVQLEGNIDTGGKSVSVLIVAVPDYEHSQDAPGDFAVTIPLLATQAKYRVKFIVEKQVIDDQIATPKNGHIKLRPVQWSPPVNESPAAKFAVTKDVSDEELRKLSIPN